MLTFYTTSPKEGNGDTTDCLNYHQTRRKLRSATAARLPDKKVVRGNYAGGCGMGRYMCYSYIGLYRVMWDYVGAGCFLVARKNYIVRGRLGYRAFFS